MKTKFTSVRVPITTNESLFVDGNSKVTRDQGTFDKPVANCFSLPHIACCPGSTETCRSKCYINGLATNAWGTYEGFLGNARVLMYLLEHIPKSSAQRFGEWIRQNCTSFRWHVSGDVMNFEHAKWISDVCSHAPEVNFWIYTRSFFWYLMPLLEHGPNLVINLSADKDNWDTAFDLWRQWSNRVRLTYLTTSIEEIPANLPKGSIIFPSYSLRGRDLKTPTDHFFWRGITPVQRQMVCPADFFGQSEHYRCGPCKKCLLQPKIN